MDDLTAEEIRAHRGTLTEPGRNSPYRDRSVAENLDLFERMREGEFPDGTRVLRAKVDMASPNLNMRDPVLYRILHAEHHRTGNKWCIYPMYDWAHGQSDSIEGITHSICTLEFEAHRPLYEWFLEQLGLYTPQQLEFARLELTYTVLSKRKLIRLVKENYVNGWDDPRMPTISGMRRRGYTSEAVRNFCDMIGVSKANSTVDLAMLEYAVRTDLNQRSDRAMAVLNPLKVTVTNYPEGQEEWFEVENNPLDPSAGTRQVPFGRELFIECEDYMENAPKSYKRLSNGREVRFFKAYLLTCHEAIKNEAGEVVELLCTYDPASTGGNAPDNRKVSGTIHWVSAAHARPAEIRLYDNLFTKENPNETAAGGDFTDNINPASLTIVPHALIEPGLQGAAVGHRYQFMRTGYFTVDGDSTAERMVFNRTVTLRDSWKP